jgi:hypothetical protein
MIKKTHAAPKCLLCISTLLFEYSLINREDTDSMGSGALISKGRKHGDRLLPINMGLEL